MRTLFDSHRSALADSLQMTADSLIAHGAGHDHWTVAFSGGKDSSATLAAVSYLIESGSARIWPAA